MLKMRKKVLTIVTILFFIFMLWHDIYAAVSTWRDPVGHISVNFIIWKHSFHSITILTISSIFLLLYFYSFPDKELLQRLSFSIMLSTFTVIFYEFWWHFGCWLSTGGGNPSFWAMYTGTIGICIFYLHKRYGLLAVSKQRLAIFIMLTQYFIFGWMRVISSGFYEGYLAFSLGQGYDPTTLLIMGNKVLGMIMWICFFRYGRVRLSDGDIELHRKKTEMWFPIQKWWHTHKSSEVMKHVPDGSGTVVDMGCGCGDMFPPLLEKGKTIIALDSDAKIIDYLKQYVPDKIQLIHEDITSSTLPNGIADTILVLDVLEHVNDPERCLIEINRILKPGGTLIITTPHTTILWSIIWKLWTIIMPYGTHEAYSRSQMLNMTKVMDATSCDIHTTHFGCLLMLIIKKKGESNCDP